MSIPQEKTYFNIFCIDKRFDALTTEYFQSVGFGYNYYLGTTAGSGLCFGYGQYCSEICNCNCNCNYGCGCGCNYGCDHGCNLSN